MALKAGDNINYVISDIHGMYKIFKKMLRIIKLKPEDNLYILGDIIDRGKDSILLVEYLWKHRNSNMFLLCGNHEDYLITFAETVKDIEGNSTKAYADAYSAQYPTYLQMRKKHTREELDKRISWLKARPFYHTVCINGKNYLLAHAGAEDLSIMPPNKEVYLWSREDFYNGKGVDGYITVFGHTPVCIIDSKMKEMHIWHSIDGNKIGIDCGCSFPHRGGRLACLRLEDGKEFYCL